ncbi:MAG TPA: hypothetical protein VGU44_00230 [Gammaproteobacteria bacterium]|nr:hypothetical protein [Gammaproteobacteria bacterium]
MSQPEEKMRAENNSATPKTESTQQPALLSYFEAQKTTQNAVAATTTHTKLMEFMEAIRTNNSVRFNALLQEKTFDINAKLSVADGEKLLPGYILYREENNPLLFALSLERMDFAVQLLADSRIKLDTRNQFGLNILHMLAFVNDTYEYTDAVTNGQSSRIEIDSKIGAEKIDKAINFLLTVQKKAKPELFNTLLNARVTACQRTPIMLCTEGPVSLKLFLKFFELENFSSINGGCHGNIFHEISSRQNQRLDIVEKLLASDNEETRATAVGLLTYKDISQVQYSRPAAWELLRTSAYAKPDAIPILNAVMLKCKALPARKVTWEAINEVVEVHRLKQSGRAINKPS